MAIKVQVHLLKVGSCRHCERVTLRGGSLAPVTFPSLAALIIHPTVGPILFDTGYAPHFECATDPFPERLYRWVTPVNLPENQLLENQLGRFGLSLSDVHTCIISHFHADHIAGLRDLPNARFIAMHVDYAKMVSIGRIRGLFNGLLMQLLPADFHERLLFAESSPRVSLAPPWVGFGDGFDLLGDGSIIGIHLPGHSAGQVGLLVCDESGREVFLCADACWSARAFQELRMPSFIARPLMHSWPGYRKTIEQLHCLSNEHPELIILPSHCNSSLSAYQNSWTGQ